MRKFAQIYVRNTKVYKIREYLPHFTTFHDQTLQFYSL